MDMNKKIFEMRRKSRRIYRKIEYRTMLIITITQEVIQFTKQYMFKDLTEEDIARNRMIAEIKELRKIDIKSTKPRTWKEYLEKEEELTRIDCKIEFIKTLEQQYMEKTINNRA